MDNNDIRKAIKDKRSSLLKKEVKEKSDIIFKNAKTLDYSGYKNFFIYKSFNKEVETSRLIFYLKDNGKNVSFPVIKGDKMIAGLPIVKEFVLSKFGTEEPKEYKEITDIDVCFLPLIACDLSFNRLGYGKGYYDRFLSENKCLKIGICYDFQIVDKIDYNLWDVPLDIIITEKRIIKKD